ncbi:hypothetical protein [Paenibacillus sp. FSL W8-0194]
MSFDFDEEDDDAYKLYTGGRRVTADASGVVHRSSSLKRTRIRRS